MKKVFNYLISCYVIDFKLNPFKFLKRIIVCLNDYRKFMLVGNSNLSTSYKYLRLFLSDNIEKTPVETTYFYQDTWMASKIFKNKPKKHFDIASNINTIGIISQYVPTTFVDIRPSDIKLNGYKQIKASILELPFKDRSISSLSSLCVIEHIGLGRYGDKIDSFGSEKAIVELQRVLAKGADLYISVPVDNSNKLYFNAHRTFTKPYLLSLFDKCELVEERYIYGYIVNKSFSPAKGYATGLFHFKRRN